ncbi:hypothetical protein LSH36_501g05027 [Paralvinella palmiformis]|uniref:Uncharacterized protein n=1 Tax=Paralvinella palmiformis TaxID=53620 RepID=A0AAD9MWU0_9ANNE|nr:hypothetical protein LSH36_501g05027 [Paralvinella palmiformis]
MAVNDIQGLLDLFLPKVQIYQFYIIINKENVSTNQNLHAEYAENMNNDNYKAWTVNIHITAMCDIYKQRDVLIKMQQVWLNEKMLMRAQGKKWPF